MGGRDHGGRRVRWLGVAAGALMAAVGAGACSGDSGSGRADEPVTEAEATEALDGMVALAAQQTPTAMAQLCQLALDDCAGFSGGILNATDVALVAPPA